jgi:hypothetical protein
MLKDVKTLLVERLIGFLVVSVGIGISITTVLYSDPILLNW